MSSTNRGAERLADDFYISEPAAINAILPHLLPLLSPDELILEPGCGEGDIIRELINSGIDPARIHGIEIDPERAEIAKATGARIVCANFLHVAQGIPAGRYGLAVGNPPYSLALPFIERTLPLARYTSFLLRVGFLGSRKRARWHQDHPANLGVLPERPSFARSMSCSNKKGGCDYKETLRLDVDHPRDCPKCGKKTKNSTSDSSEYAFFTWTPEGSHQVTILDMESTHEEKVAEAAPPKVRKAREKKPRTLSIKPSKIAAYVNAEMDE